MLWLLLLQGNNSAKPTLDLSQIDPTFQAVLTEVGAGSRYVRLSRIDGPAVHYSPVLLVRKGESPPEGWTGGVDVTQTVMHQVGLPAHVVANANKTSTPVRFARGLDVPVRYTRLRGAVVVAFMLFVVGIGSLLAYDMARDAYNTSLVSCGVLGSFSAIAICPLTILLMAMLNLPDRGGPLEGQKWWPVYTIPLVFPVIVAAMVGRLELGRVEERLAAGLAGLDIDAPDFAAGFSVADPTRAEVSPEKPDLFDGWTLYENLHPTEVPLYGPDDLGVIVEWSPTARRVAAFDVLLPDALRAESQAQTRWIAYVARGQVADAVQYTNGITTTLQWINLRIVDVPTGRLVAHGTAMASAPRQAKEPPRLVTIGDPVTLTLVQSAIQPSYVGAPK